MQRIRTGWDGRSPRSFAIDINSDTLVRLRQRLRETRWPDAPPNSSWEYGADLSYMKDLCHYWADNYNWRQHELAINQFRHFKVTIDGSDVHFVHERGEGDNPTPILLIHGWPGSFYEYHKLIPMLTHPSRFGGDPASAFSVVVPSMPGYGLSFDYGQKRAGLEEIAKTLFVLMHDVLEYRQFLAHGHDWGSFVSTRLGYSHPEAVRGIHITLLAVPRDPSINPRVTEEERRYALQLDHWLSEESGYSIMMATKPQTLAYALTDSPAGLAAWILEKFRSWSDCNGDVDAYFGRDVLLTNVMLYWLTGAIGSSFWPYYARKHGPWIVPDGARVMVPTAYAAFPKEILSPPRSIAEKTYGNITRWTEMSRGGHFAALEEPNAVAADLRAFAASLR